MTVGVARGRGLQTEDGFTFSSMMVDIGLRIGFCRERNSREARGDYWAVEGINE